jgi:peptidoglycan lytic transglycosylase
MTNDAQAKRTWGFLGKNKLYSLALLVLILPFTFSFNDFIEVKQTEVKEEVETKKVEIKVNDFDISKEFSFEDSGTASWYGKRFHRRKTANGERYNMHANTAAHRKLPFGTILRVTNKNSGLSTLIRVNDRGPYVGKRILDLSKKAAIDIDGKGLPKVKLEGLIANVKFEDDYYFIYSYESSPMCLPKELLTITDSSMTFARAIEKMDQLNTEVGHENYRLIVSASDRRRSDKGKDYKYFLGEVKRYRIENSDIAQK